MQQYTVYLTIDPDPSGSRPMTGTQHLVYADSNAQAVRKAGTLTGPTLAFPATIIAASATCMATGVCATYNVKRDGLPQIP